MAKRKAVQGRAVVARVKAPGPNTSGVRKPAGRTHDLSLALPHERDEASTHYDETPPAPEIKQAYEDLEKGLVDTDRRAQAAGNFERAWPGRPKARRRSGG